MYMGNGDGGSNGPRGDARSSSGRQQIVFPIIPENQTADRLAIRNRANLYPPFGPQCNPREFRVRRWSFGGIHRV